MLRGGIQNISNHEPTEQTQTHCSVGPLSHTIGADGEALQICNEYWGNTSCQGTYRSLSRARLKSTDATRRVTTKSSVQRNSVELPRSFGRSRQLPSSLTSARRQLAAQSVGCQVSMSRRQALSPRCSLKSSSENNGSTIGGMTKRQRHARLTVCQNQERGVA